MKLNPYGAPLREFMNEIKNIKPEFPFIPNIIQFSILIFLIILNSVLYPTIGVISQIRDSIWNLIEYSKNKMDTPSVTSSESFSYLIAIFIYLIFISPFDIIEFPFIFFEDILKPDSIPSKITEGRMISFGISLIICFILSCLLFGYLYS